MDWERDMANNLHNDDALWLWAAKAAHIFMEWRMKGIMDPVLHRLFAIGLFDWTVISSELGDSQKMLGVIPETFGVHWRKREREKSSSTGPVVQPSVRPRVSQAKVGELA